MTDTSPGVQLCVVVTTAAQQVQDKARDIATKTDRKDEEEEEERASRLRLRDVNSCETCNERKAEDMFGGVECWNCMMGHTG